MKAKQHRVNIFFGWNFFCRRFSFLFAFQMINCLFKCLTSNLTFKSASLHISLPFCCFVHHGKLEIFSSETSTTENFRFNFACPTFVVVLFCKEKLKNHFSCFDVKANVHMNLRPASMKMC
jgi:hypothetical protein